MSALVLHVLPGMLAGALFRLQTLMILASAVLVAAAVFFMQSGAPAGLSWLLVSQCAFFSSVISVPISAQHSGTAWRRGAVNSAINGKLINARLGALDFRAARRSATMDVGRVWF